MSMFRQLGLEKKRLAIGSMSPHYMYWFVITMI